MTQQETDEDRAPDKAAPRRMLNEARARDRPDQPDDALADGKGGQISAIDVHKPEQACLVRR
jgi:hypothetical protein